MRRREYFEIKKYARVYDRREGKFIISLSYRTATDITPRTIKVAEAFGIGTDEREFIIYDNVELKIGPKDIVYSSPGIASFGRKKAFGRRLSIDELNRDVTRISRVVVLPKYRTIGLGVKLVQKTLFRAGKLYIETVAVMARYNPFFEHAGLTKIAESKPNPRILSAIEELAAIGFNPVFLSSTRYNLQRLRNNPATIDQVKVILKRVSRSGGVYRKRIASVGQAYLTHEQFCERVDKANAEKLAKMLRILSFLTQRKVYLFWENPAISFLDFLEHVRRS